MEPHPVPQNIIDVEFKLFGAFSLRQFGVILVGCMVGVVIYFIPFIPFIVKIPLIFIAVMVGLLSAIIPNFGTWMTGFAKALLIAPRYVWVKEPAHSDILESAETVVNKTKEGKINQVNSQKTDLDSLVISDVMQEKDDVTDDFLIDNNINSVQKQNFGQMYDKVFEDTSSDKIFQSVKTEEDKNSVNIQSQSATAAAQLENSHSAGLQSAEGLTIEQILNSIEQLKNDLAIANRNSDKDAESKILNRINDLYSQYKVLKTPGTTSTTTTQNNKVRKFLNSDGEGKIIFGIVVTKSDKTIEAATVFLANLETKQVFVEKTSKDGKFATKSKLPIGDYDVRIEHPDYKFHTYKIQITEGRLPAFKFREK